MLLKVLVQNGAEASAQASSSRPFKIVSFTSSTVACNQKHFFQHLSRHPISGWHFLKSSCGASRGNCFGACPGVRRGAPVQNTTFFVCVNLCFGSDAVLDPSWTTKVRRSFRVCGAPQYLLLCIPWEPIPPR